MLSLSNTPSASTPDMQARILEEFREDIRVFGPDQINLIKAYLPQTGVHTRMIEVFEQMRGHVMVSKPKDPKSKSLYERYNTARKEFNSHLGYRIECLKKPDQTTPHDPWFKLSVSSGNKDLLEASFNLQDHLTDIEIILKYEIEEGCEAAMAEIKELLQVIPQYFAKLEGKNQSQSQSLMEKLTTLEKHLTAKKFDEAKKTFSEIQNQLDALIANF